jgi:hypothetical protein
VKPSVKRDKLLGIDRRQRIAASMLLLGFDLPAESEPVCKQMIEAAGVCPGLTMGDVAPMGKQGRRSALTAARQLIDEMLAELPA